MSGPKRATIHDIAHRAGTSSATVSRVLSGGDYPVSQALRAKVMEAARQLHYAPNALGRMLKKNETREIGVVIPTIANPYYTQVVVGIEEEAQQRGWNILLCNTHRNPALERHVLQSLAEKQVRRVILATVQEDPSFLLQMREEGMELVLLDPFFDPPLFPSVDFDFFQAGRMATVHLLERGHRRIAFLSSPLNRSARREFFAGYRQALQDWQVDYDPGLLLLRDTEEDAEPGGFEFACGRHLAARMLALARLPDAAVVINDMTAAGVLQYLSEEGVGIPGALSMISMDNIPLAAMVSPPLTTVEHPAIPTGRTACRLLLEPEDHPANVRFSPALHIRSTVAPR